MGLINKELDNLKDSDILSFILFALFKLKDAPEYSGLSELAYILDKENLFKLCEYFGGLTLRIPTIFELETLIHALLIYKYIDIDKQDIDQVFSQLPSEMSKRDVKKCYLQVKELLTDYNITSRGKL